MVDKTRFLRVDVEDLRVANGIASFKGLTLKKYFRSLIDEEAKNFQYAIKNDPAAYRRNNR